MVLKTVAEGPTQHIFAYGSGFAIVGVMPGPWIGD